MFEIARTNEDLDPEHPDKIHFIDLQEYGMKAELIPAGSTVEIKILNPGENQFTYIHSGYREYYENIPGQECDWDTEHTEWNRNCTSADWGFYRGILYTTV
jgi:hypothetical protein